MILKKMKCTDTLNNSPSQNRKVNYMGRRRNRGVQENQGKLKCSDDAQHHPEAGMVNCKVLSPALV